jgi:cyclase
MLTRRIIPCLDVRDGRVVKGVRFVDLADHGDPAALARRYEAEGADELVILDITATVEGRLATRAVVEACADVLAIPLTVGGGVKDVDSVRALLAAGADKVAVNSAAVRDPEMIRRAAREFGSQCVVLAIDARELPIDVAAGGESVFEVVIDGGRTAAGMDAVRWARDGVARGAGEILLTSIDRDGTGQGFDIELTRAVSRAVPVPVIASGGARDPEHFLEAFRSGEADAALAAGVFHRGEATVASLKSYLREKGVEVRA